MDTNGNVLSPPDARALTLDLFAAHDGDRFTSAELIRAGAVFGHSATAMRTAIARLRRDGRLAAAGRGLYGPGSLDDPWRRRIDGWRETPARRAAWSGGWLMAAARPSSVSRTAWRATLRALDVEGFRQSAQGLWLRPDTLAGGVAACRERLAAYGATAELLTGRLEGLNAASAGRTRPLWDVAGLAALRRDLLERLEASHARLPALPRAEAAREALMLGRAVVRAIVRDPLLPAEWDQAPSLERLVDAMAPYDRAGRAAWLAYLDRPAEPVSP